MTTAGARLSSAHGGAVHWTRAAVLVLLAAFAVLVHHETGAAGLAPVPTAEAPAIGGMAGMDHTSSMTTPTDLSGHDTTRRASTPVLADTDHGACSGMAMQHCSTARVDTVKLAPPSTPSLGGGDAVHPGVPTGREVPETVSRAPPDLSVLSRLLI